VQLESVRALREELSAELGSVSTPRPSPAGLGRILEYASRRIGYELPTARRARRPPIALGIARGKRDDYALAVRVQEEQLLNSRAVGTIRDRANGEVDVRYIGRPVPLSGGGWHKGRCRPLRAGASVGSQAQKTTGTMGCFVQPRGGGPLHLLSNAHVLIGWGQGSRGDAIAQPGWDDEGRDENAQIGTVAEYVPLIAGQVHDVDCAVALLDDGAPSATGPGTVAEADVDEALIKDGRTTGRTTGRTLAIEAGPIEFDYPTPLGTLVFDGVTEVDGVGDGRFARRGDSGSLVLNEDGAGVGLLFAVTDVGGRNNRGIAYLCPLSTALDRLKVELVSST
jgi:hypothetical protein